MTRLGSVRSLGLREFAPLDLRPSVFLMCIFASVAGAHAASAQEFKSAKTPEGVHRKAVITIDDGKLYKDRSGDPGTALSLMDVVFIMDGATGDRVPVSRSPDADKPDGWLAKSSFVEWNSVQMIDFAAQGGRKLVEVYQDAQCAIDFANTGRSACKPVGREPDRRGVKADYKMLVPVFTSKADKATTVYEGGFVRISTGAAPKVAPPAPAPESSAPSRSSGGIELVVAVDATFSMVEWFRPTAAAISDFVAKVKADVGSGELPEVVRIGLLMYQDRKIGQECALDFITDWKVLLTETSDSKSADETIAALSNAKVANCGSDEAEEAVFDALNRAILDPQWKDGSFRVVALIGDAPPHGEANERKNPLRLSQAVLHKEADARNVRFIATWIKRDPGTDTSSFQKLAEERRAELRGRFAAINGNPATVQTELGASLWREWTEIVKPYRTLVLSGRTKEDVKADPSIIAKAGGTDYSTPIIINMLPDEPASRSGPAFSRGWMPDKIDGKTAVDEYVFMSRASLRLLLGAMNAVLGQAEQNKAAGADDFITALRSSLASQFKVNPDEIFAQGETLSAMLKKRNVLPFDTGLLRFTADEVRQWRPEDYERVVKLLGERVTQLEKFTQVATNARSFGSVPHFFVPQDLFP